VRKVLDFDGKPTEFFTVEDLAQLLGRHPQSVRRYERTGLIPKARFRLPSKDPWGGGRRVYTAEQLRAVERAMRKHGIAGKQRVRGGFPKAFTDDVLRAWRADAEGIARALNTPRKTMRGRTAG